MQAWALGNMLGRRPTDGSAWRDAPWTHVLRLDSAKASKAPASSDSNLSLSLHYLHNRRIAVSEMSSADHDSDPPIRLHLPPLSPSLFDSEPPELSHGSSARPSSDPSSPTSSGYAAERGGSSTATSVSQVDDVLHHEIQEITIHDSQPSSHSSWLPGKRHGDEV